MGHDTTERNSIRYIQPTSERYVDKAPNEKGGATASLLRFDFFYFIPTLFRISRGSIVGIGSICFPAYREGVVFLSFESGG